MEVDKKVTWEFLIWLLMFITFAAHACGSPYDSYRLEYNRSSVGWVIPRRAAPKTVRNNSRFETAYLEIHMVSPIDLPQYCLPRTRSPLYMYFNLIMEEQ